jgi:hypothetical protein
MIAMEDDSSDNSIDENDLPSPFVRKSSGGNGIRRASLGDSFSIESEPDDNDDADDDARGGGSNSSSSDPNNVVKVVDNQHPTIVAYEAELRRAFAAVGGGDRTKGSRIGSSSSSSSSNSSQPINKIDEATKQKEITSYTDDNGDSNNDDEEKKVGEYKRGTSDYWDEKIQKKEEEKQQRRKLKGVLEGATSSNTAPPLQTKSSCAVVPIDVSMDNEEEEGDNIDEENGTTTLPHVNDGQEKEEPTPQTTTKYHKKFIILSILLLMVLVLILGLVIGLRNSSRNDMNGTQTNNLRGESDSTVSTVKPVESSVPINQSTIDNITNSELPISTTATESVVEMAPAAPTTSSAEAAPTTAVAPTLICNPKTPSTTTTTTSSNSSSEQCPPDSTSALQLLEKCTSSYNNTSPTTTSTTIDRYGTSIAINHDNGNNILAVIGANFDNHATLLRYDKVTRSWSHVSDLNSRNNDSSIDSGSSSSNTNNSDNNNIISYDRFGSAVAISSKWIAISTPYDISSTGYVTMYQVSNAVQNGNNAVPEVTLVQEDATLGSRFGSSLAMDDDLLVIGAVRDRNGAGSVYIYRVGESLGDDNSNGWTQVTKLQPEDVSSDDPQGNFGHSVAISQGIVVVGAPNDTCLDNKQQQRCGSVYIFQQAPGGFAFVQKISPQDLSVGDQFGYSVTVEVAFNPTTAVREDRIAIGTHMDDDKGMNSGSVYVFVRRDGERLFSLEQKLLPKEWSPRSTFGTSVDMQGHRMIVGSEGYGVAHLFEYDGESWIEVGSTNDVDSGRALGDDFGSSVGIASWDESDDNSSAGVALVGAPLNDENGEDSGQIYSYAICS